MFIPYPGLSDKNYRPDIDGLRAVAVILVVIFHAFPIFAPGGYIGVDIFFVISGFLITNIIRGDLDCEKFSFVHFYSRRIRRIFPSLLAVLIFCLIFGWFCLLPDEFSQMAKATASAAGFATNFVLMGESGYFDVDAYRKILLHLWSLAIEEQFYILWPLILLVLFKLKKKLIFFTILMLSLSFIYDLYLIRYDQVSAFYNPFSRVWELLIGSCLALVPNIKFVSKLFANKKKNDAMSLVGLSFIGLGVFLINPQSRFPGLWALFPTMGAALLIFSGKDAFVNSKLLQFRILIFIGIISFPVYLWHWPFLTFLRIIEGDNASPFFCSIAVFLSFIFAIASYYLLERPIRYSGKYKSVITWFLLLLMLVVGIFGFYIFMSKGFPARNQAAEDFRKNNWSYNWWKTEACAEIYLSISSDCVTNSGKSPEILLVGDSHVQGLYMSLAELLPNASIMRFGSYNPFFSIEDLATPSIEANRILNFVIQNNTITTIIIGFRASRVLQDNYNPAIAEPYQSYRDKLNVTLERLSRSGKRIIFILDNPELDFNPSQCIDIRPMYFSSYVIKTPCAISKSGFEKTSQRYRQISLSIISLYPNIYGLDVSKLLCDDNLCWAKIGDKLLYMDSNHLSVEGSNIVAKELKTYIEK